MTKASETRSWGALGRIAKSMVAKGDHANIGLSFEAFSFRLGKILIDLSKQRIDRRALSALIDLAVECGIHDRIERQLDGHEVNRTEGRRALHTALRATEGDEPVDAVAAALAQREAVLALAEDIRTGAKRGYTGAAFTHVLHIGIGGSHLGPELVVDALGDRTVEVRFLANLDGASTDAALAGLDPRTTLVIIVSKTFTTLETLTNAEAARSWFLERTCEPAAVADHFIGVSANADAMDRFGISAANRFALWDWVGGRYSLWSAVGLPIAIAIGRGGFTALLEGAREVDRHFRSAPLERNVPVLLALLTVWNTNFLGAGTHAVLAYDTRLRLLADFLQQLEMESNGKTACEDGEATTGHTSPVVWGGEETNGQHAFHQLLHQGTRAYSADFVATVNPDHERAAQHRWMLANCLSQSEAMLVGADYADPLAVHRAVRGDHPSTTFLLDTLDPASLGALIAIYEHKVASLGILWNINSFDQFGVELGKNLARTINEDLGLETPGRHDSSTRGLIDTIRKRSL